MTAPSSTPPSEPAPDDLTPEERAAYRASGGVLQNCAQNRPRPLCRAPDCLIILPLQEWRAARKKLCAKSPPARTRPS